MLSFSKNKTSLTMHSTGRSLHYMKAILSIMLTVMIVSSIGIISQVKANAASTIKDISTVGSITLEKFVLKKDNSTKPMIIDGTQPVNDSDFTMSMNMILHGQIDHVEYLKPGDIIRIPISSTGHMRFHEFSINPSVMNTDGVQLFTANAVNCDNTDSCYLDLTTSDAIASYSGSSQLDLSPVVSFIQNRHSRETILSRSTTVTVSTSSMTITNVFPWGVLDYDDLGAGYLDSGIGYVKFHFGTAFFHSATQYLKTGKIIPQATVDRVITAKFTALNGGIKSFEMLSSAWSSSNLAFDENSISSMESGGALVSSDQLNEVNGDLSHGCKTHSRRPSTCQRGSTR